MQQGTHVAARLLIVAVLLGLASPNFLQDVSDGSSTGLSWGTGPCSHNQPPNELMYAARQWSCCYVHELVVRRHGVRLKDAKQMQAARECYVLALHGDWMSEAAFRGLVEVTSSSAPLIDLFMFPQVSAMGAGPTGEEVSDAMAHYLEGHRSASRSDLETVRRPLQNRISSAVIGLSAR